MIAALFFFYEFVQMNMFNAVNSQLMQDFNVNAAKLGALSSAYFIANIIFMFPAGILLDRFSTRRLIVIAMLICITGTLAFSFVDTLHSAVICRFLTGIGGSFPFLCCLRLASRWFKPRQMALITGLMVTMAMLGGMAAQTPLTILVQHTTWRIALRFDALMGVVFLALILWQVRDFPKLVTIKESKLPSLSLGNIARATIAIIISRCNWLFSFYTCLLNLPLMLLGGLWGSLYLTQVRGFTPIQASFATSMLFLGTIVGSPILGWISDRMANRHKPMLYGAFITIFLTVLLMETVSLSVPMTMLIFFAIGFSTSTQIIAYPAIAETNPANYVGSALGFASVIIMGGPAFFEPLFGHILDLHWNGALQNGAHLYSPTAFFDAMTIFPIAGVLAVTTILLTRKSLSTHCFQNLAKDSLER